MPSRDDLIYAAAMVDGEGHVGLYCGGDNKRAVYGSVCVSNSNPVLAQWFLGTFGGTVHEKRGKGNEKDHFSWSIPVSGGRMVAFLRAILPHLKLKQHQAKLVLDVYATPHIRGCRVAPAETQRRLALRIEVGRLNRKGKVSVHGDVKFAQHPAVEYGPAAPGWATAQ